MEKSLYTKKHVAERAATGALGSFAAQVNYGTQFASSGKFSIQANREFDTYANALAYANSHMSAFPGIILTVSDDTTGKNGVYLVSHDTVTESNPNGLKLSKLSKSDDTGAGSLSWGEITDNGIITLDIDDLEIENTIPDVNEPGTEA